MSLFERENNTDFHKRQSSRLSLRAEAPGFHPYVQFTISGEEFELPQGQFRVLVLASAGLLPDQIASELDIDYQTVKNQTYKATEYLSSYMRVDKLRVKPIFRRHGFTKPELYSRFDKLDNVSHVLKDWLPSKASAKPTVGYPIYTNHGVKYSITSFNHSNLGEILVESQSFPSFTISGHYLQRLVSKSPRPLLYRYYSFHHHGKGVFDSYDQMEDWLIVNKAYDVYHNNKELFHSIVESGEFREYGKSLNEQGIYLLPGSKGFNLLAVTDKGRAIFSNSSYKLIRFLAYDTLDQKQISKLADVSYSTVRQELKNPNSYFISNRFIKKLEVEYIAAFADASGIFDPGVVNKINAITSEYSQIAR